ncbi:MAG: carboxylating nicotinate-nucleotide diphosphorylase [Nitrospira sp.]|nr:carboxylating nicotinate-nucleotide diphosphorylase [Nitrospira sp.]MDH4303560.1 carboxylating nicotinate-nucleotide diphosphorylase [Nitrospira sp.]MDH5192955.1 carboxylating nicotinate-nucleotide diphosphorylase [Nitrospira sp.]
MITLPAADIRRAVRQGLEEDLAQGDATTTALFSAPVPAQATIIAQQPLVVAGMAAAVQTFLMVDPSLRLSISKRDGDRAKSGDPLLQIEGDGRGILQAERVALNFLQHLSGIATVTQQFCRATRGYPVKILDTRKTIPGWRTLQKWAVALGGGTNHRYSLSDGILIKDNHLALLQSHQRPVEQACRLAQRHRSSGLPIIVEVESLSEVRQALAGKPDVILLDNMTPDMVRRAVALIKKRALVEVSGGITLNNVCAMAAAGADRISIGALTHSAAAATVSLVMTSARRATRRHR